MTSKYSRLDRYLSKQLNIKKKDIRLLLAHKRVIVDGCVATDTQLIIGPFNHILVDQQTLNHQQALYFMMHKPKGVVSATSDAIHPTALSLMKLEQPAQLHIAGRLDLNSTGLLIITNDGKWSSGLTNPLEKVNKCYIVELKNELTNQYIEAFAKGMHFPYENITTQPAELEILSKFRAKVILREGKYHQIKRMFGRFRNEVVGLHRESIGNLILPEDLLPGQYKALTSNEINSIILS